ncbi:hypothetical protein HYX08_00685 [Candidatus Woesearchaeota archaeon]|nr:hypothetical protein [Candidatus Woesearchaeota archaeon]
MASFVTGESLSGKRKVAELRQSFQDELNRRISELGLEATVETNGRAGPGLYAVVSETETRGPLPAHLRKSVIAETRLIAPNNQYGGFDVYIVARARDNE